MSLTKISVPAITDEQLGNIRSVYEEYKGTGKKPGDIADEARRRFKYDITAPNIGRLINLYFKNAVGNGNGPTISSIALPAENVKSMAASPIAFDVNNPLASVETMSVEQCRMLIVQLSGDCVRLKAAVSAQEETINSLNSRIIAQAQLLTK